MKRGIKVQTAIRGGRLAQNHSRQTVGIKIKTAIRGGRLATNHCRQALG